MDTTETTTMPEATVTPEATAPAKAPRKPSKASKGKVAKTSANGKGKATTKAEDKARVNHVAQVQAKVGKRRIVWQGKPLNWPKAAKDSGKRAEAILKGAGSKGMSYAEYAGSAGASINRLGYMLRKEAAKLA